jgi:hypothetical protein
MLRLCCPDKEITMAVAFLLSPARSHLVSGAGSAQLARLGQAAAALLQHWQGRAAEQSGIQARIRRTEKAIQVQWRRVSRLPLASRARSAARFEALSLECTLQAYRAVMRNRMQAAAGHYAEATWFAQEARRMACWSGPA